MTRSRRATSHRLLLLIPAGCFLLAVGCPHRSPVISPDGQHVLLLAGAEKEDVEKPASQLWLLSRDGDSWKSRRLRAPARERPVRYLAGLWDDNRHCAVLTVEWEREEAIEDTAAVWRVDVESGDWARLDVPPPSAERTPRRQPVILRPGNEEEASRLVYATGSEKVVAVDLKTGDVLREFEPAEIVGPGPDGGFLTYSPDDETGDIDLAAYGPDLEPRWKKGFSDLAREIAARTGKNRSDIVFNDTSLSEVGPRGVGVQLVFTDVNWKDGVSGYYALLSGADGSVKRAQQGIGLPGNPGTAADSRKELWAWVVSPATAGGASPAVIRAHPLTGEGEAMSQPLADIDRRAIHGYAVSPDRKTLVVVVNGPRTQVMFYPIDGGRITGKPVEISL